MVMIGRTLFGKKDKAKQFQQYTPQQMQGLQQLFQALTGGGGPFQDLFGEFNPEQTSDVFQRGVAEPAMRNFRQRVIPQIMESFGDQGESSGLYNSLASAGRDLQSQLGSQGELFMNQSRLQNLQNRLTGVQSALGAQPYQTYTQQGYAGVLPNLLNSFGQSAGQSLGFMPWGQNQNPYAMQGQRYGYGNYGGY